MALITIGVSTDIPIYVHLKDSPNNMVVSSFRVEDFVFAKWDNSLRYLTVMDMQFKTSYGVFALWNPLVRHLHVEMRRRRIFARTLDMTEKSEIVSHWFTHS